MKNQKTRIILMLTFIAIVLTGCMGCDNCGKTTYRPEIGVGFVFKETDSGLVPVAGATVTVSNIYQEFGLFGKKWIVAEESYNTDIDGRYQVRFVEKGCYTKNDGSKEMVHCNGYDFYYEIWINNGTKRMFGFSTEKIENNAQNNILMLDTLKLK